MSCKQCKYYMDCAIFADALEREGVAITTSVASMICECMLLGDIRE